MNSLIMQQGSLSSLNTIESYIEKFLASLDIKEASKHTYKRQLKEFVAWLKKRSIDQPSRTDLIQYKEYLQNTKQLSALTIGGYLTALRRFFEWLEYTNIYPNAAKSIKGPKRRKGFRKDALSIDQARRLLQVIDTATLVGKRDFALINLMIRTGLRTIEIIRAKKEDITLFSGVYVLWIHGKGRDSKDEFVVLTEKTLVPIQHYISHRGPIKSGSPLFASLSTKNFGGPLTTRSISRIVKNRLKEIGINDNRITAHSLRHTAITLSLLAGSTPQEARALARHSDINTTMIYAHNIARIQDAPEYKIDNYFDLS